jgi:hypothetical protein
MARPRPLRTIWLLPAPGDMPLAAYPGTWSPRIAGVE